MNITALSGRLTKDPEERYFADGTAVSKFRIAVEAESSKQNADFFDCEAFGKTAEFINQYFHKGSRIEIVGKIKNNNYQTQDGRTVYGTLIRVSEARFGETKAEAERAVAATTAPQSGPAAAAEKDSGKGGKSSRKAAGKSGRGRKGTSGEDGFMNIPDGIEESLPFV